MNGDRGEKLLAALGALVVPALYSELFALQQSPLSLIPFLIGLISPPAGVAVAPVTALLLLYLDMPLITYVLAAPMLLTLSRAFTSWRHALVALIAVPVMLLSPLLAPVVLGAAIAAFSSEDEVGAVLSGAVFSILLYVTAALVLPSDTVIMGLLFLPGGIASSLYAITDVGRAGEFYMAIMNKVFSTPSLLEELAVIPLASLAGTLAKRRWGNSGAALLSSAVVGVGSLTLPSLSPQWITGMTLLLGSAAVTYMAPTLKNDLRVRRVSKKRMIPRKKHIERKTRRREAMLNIDGDILELVMHDLRSTAEAVKSMAARGARVIIMGPRPEDELLFSDYVFKAPPPENVYLSHRLGPAWYERVKGYVAYIPPLDPEEAVDVLEAYCRLKGITPPEELLKLAREKLKGISRYLLATLLEQMSARNCDTGYALQLLYSVKPDIKPSFFISFERVSGRLPIIGLKG